MKNKAQMREVKRVAAVIRDEQGADPEEQRWILERLELGVEMTTNALAAAAHQFAKKDPDKAMRWARGKRIQKGLYDNFERSSLIQDRMFPTGCNCFRCVTSAWGFIIGGILLTEMKDADIAEAAWKYVTGLQEHERREVS